VSVFRLPVNVSVWRLAFHIQTVPDSYLNLIICKSLRGQTGNWYIIVPFWTFPGITLHLCGRAGARNGAVIEALRYNRKVAGSIPVGVIGIFHWHNPSGRTMALGLTQTLTEMSKVKVTQCRPPRAWRGNRGIAVRIHDLGARRGWVPGIFSGVKTAGA
jgi:hypothetical protein